MTTGSVFKRLFSKLPKSGIWLRDHCRCHLCFHPITKQRLINTSDIDIHITPKKVDLIDNLVHVLCKRV
jgi:hypothetical protein